MITETGMESLNNGGPDASAPISKSMPDAHGWGPHFKASSFSSDRYTTDHINSGYDTSTIIDRKNLKTETTEDRNNPIAQTELNIEATNISNTHIISTFTTILLMIIKTGSITRTPFPHTPTQPTP